MRALASAVVGRMERLPTILVAALGLGVVEAAITYSTGRPKLIDPIVFVIILGALIIQRRRAAGRVDDDQTSTWQAAREVRPIPRELADVPEVRWIPRIFIGVLALGLVFLPAYFETGVSIWRRRDLFDTSACPRCAHRWAGQ